MGLFRARAAFKILFVLSFTAISALSAISAETEMFYENASGGQPVFTLINTARQTLDIEHYEMKDPRILSAVRDAVDRGVRVRVVAEGTPVGATCKLFEPAVQGQTPGCAAQRALKDYILQKGGSYVPFNKAMCGMMGSNCFQHGKMVISDHRYVLLSTGNFNPTSFCNESEKPAVCNRDYSVVSSDPSVIRTLTAVFEHDLVGSTASLESVVSRNSKITVGPFALQPIVRFIQSARKTIQIEAQYLKDPQMNQAIIDAAQRGVQVFVTVASFCSFGRPSASEIASVTKIYSVFDQAKIHTRIFTNKIMVNGHAGYLHAKAILVDSRVAWIGSTNGSTTSLMSNREFGIFLDGDRDIHRLGKFLYDDYTHQNTETWAESLECKKDMSSHMPDWD